MGRGVPGVRKRRRGARRGRNTSSEVILSRQVRWVDTAEAAPVDVGDHGEDGLVDKWLGGALAIFRLELDYP